jgi:Domain of unknown function DUF29
MTSRNLTTLVNLDKLSEAREAADTAAKGTMSEYETDVLAWSDHQAELLRRVAAGERVNDLVDWTNVVEEIESVGQSQIDAVESLWTQAFLHDLKAEAWPLALDVDKWRADARLFRRQARRKYRPSMRQRFDLAELYGDALAGLPDRMDGQAPLPVPQACPVTLDELLSDD